jgi:hypothetical protein
VGVLPHQVIAEIDQPLVEAGSVDREGAGETGVFNH